MCSTFIVDLQHYHYYNLPQRIPLGFTAVAQHFLLTAAARSLSLKSIFRMSDDEAHATFTAIRFADNGGAAFCPRCECTAVYTYAARRIWKCKDCLRS